MVVDGNGIRSCRLAVLVGIAALSAACSSEPCPECDAASDCGVDASADADGDGDVDGDADADGDADGEPDGGGDADADAEADADWPVDADEDTVAPECVQASDCDDGDGCTAERCEEGVCRSVRPDSALLRLDASGADWAELSLDLGGVGLDPDSIFCESTRNEVPIVVESFDEGGLETHRVTGDVTLLGEADATDPTSGFGLSICGPGSSLTLGPYDLTAYEADRAVLRVAANADDLAGGEVLEIWVSDDGGTSWTILAGAGDGNPTAGWHHFAFVLPDSVQISTTVDVLFVRRGGSAGGCAWIDDVALVEAPSAFDSDVLLMADFDDAVLDPLVGVVTQPDDLQLNHSSGAGYIIIWDSLGSYVEGRVDTTAIGANSALQLSWLVQHTGDWLDHAEYMHLLLSLDDGATWLQQASFGYTSRTSGWSDHAVVLPHLARDRADLRFRFLMPETSGARYNEGALLDEIAVTVERLDPPDAFAAFEDRGDGTYATTLTSSESGEREVVCRWICEGSEVVSTATALDLR